MESHMARFTFAHAVTHSTQPERAICVFWRRFFAFFIDSAALAFLGFLLAIPSWEVFADLGPAGRIVGFFLGMAYFALPESKRGGGQSLGKRLMKIRVVDCSGNCLSLELSILRYMIFAVPLQLNGLPLPFSRTPWFVMLMLGAVVFGVGGVALYLLIFNRRTRQGLHDLATGSYVVSADMVGAVETKPIWKKHWLVVGAILVVLGPVFGFVVNKITHAGPFPHVIDDVRIVEEMAEVDQASVNETTVWRSAGGTSSKSLNVQVARIGRQDNPSDFADRVARTILLRDAKANQYDTIRISVVRGYDLGFVHASRWWNASHTPQEWRQTLGMTGSGMPEE